MNGWKYIRPSNFWMMYSKYSITIHCIGRYLPLELHTLTSVDLAVQIKRATLSKDCNTRTGLHFRETPKNLSTFLSEWCWQNGEIDKRLDHWVGGIFALIKTQGEFTLNVKVSKLLGGGQALLLENECLSFGGKNCSALSPQLSTIYSALGEPEAPAWLSSSDMRTHFFLGKIYLQT